MNNYARGGGTVPAAFIHLEKEMALEARVAPVHKTK